MQKDGIEAIINDEYFNKFYRKSWAGITFGNVYYKVSHHGKRAADFATCTGAEYQYRFRYNESVLILEYVRPNNIVGTVWEKSSAYLNTYRSVYNVWAGQINLEPVEAIRNLVTQYGSITASLKVGF